MRIGIDASKNNIVGKKKDADRSGIDIGFIGIVCYLSIVGNKILSFQLSETALNAMVMIGMTDRIGSIRTMTANLMGRLAGELQCTIGWGVGSVYTIGLVIVLNIFPGIRKNLKRWPMHEFLMNSYFVGMLILIGWSQGKVVAHRQGSNNFLHGVERG